MGNIVKFNETRLDNSIKSGGFNIGVNDTPTDLTGFYNGISPILSGYTIYIDKPSDGPSIYTPQNDTDLVDITNKLGGSVSTAAEALEWINFQNNMTVLNSNYPSIVTDGLVLNLDAGFVSSYPRTGTTWTDLSGSGNTGTLFNGPTYNSDNGGSIVFDGVDDYANVYNINLGQNGAIDVWFIVYELPTVAGDALMFGQYYKYIIYSNNNTPLSGLYHFMYHSNGYVSPGFFSITTNTWYNSVVTYNENGEFQSYLNGVLRVDSVATNFTSWLNNFTNFKCGGYRSESGTSMVKLYTKQLTAEEVLQNYYAGLQRFIPTDGLVLSLDAQNTNLYATSPTTAYDISGNNNNGSMLNGTQYVGDGDGSWSFDGIDDRVVTNFNTLDLSSTWNVWVNRTQSKNVYNMIMGMYLPYFGFRSNGDIHFSININGQKSLYAGVSLSDNVWYFMSFVSSYSDGNTTIMIYLNGVLQNQATYAGQQRTNPQSFMMGTWYSGGTYPFNGKIGQVQIYNRALTQTEITTIFNATRTRYGV